MLLVYLLSWMLQVAPDPQITARWDSGHSATVAFTLVSRGCLSVTHATNQRVFLSCYEEPGSYRIELGHGLTDGTARPQAGDVYTLQTGGGVFRAPLRGRAQYLAVWRR